MSTQESSISDDLTVIAEAARIQGELRSEGRVEFWGILEGTGAFEELFLYESGRIEGQVTAKTATLFGFFRGRLL